MTSFDALVDEYQALPRAMLDHELNRLRRMCKVLARQRAAATKARRRQRWKEQRR